MDLFIKFLDDSVDGLKQEETELINSDRKDESDIVKVKINIFRMCKAIYKTVSRQCKKENVRDVFCKRLDEFTSNWERSYEKALKFDDAKKVLVERTKLDTLQYISNYFLNMGVSEYD